MGIASLGALRVQKMSTPLHFTACSKDERFAPWDKRGAAGEPGSSYVVVGQPQNNARSSRIYHSKPISLSAYMNTGKVVTVSASGMTPQVNFRPLPLKNIRSA